MSNDHPDSGHGTNGDAEVRRAASVEDPGAQALSDALRSSFNVVKFLMRCCGRLVVSCILR